MLRDTGKKVCLVTGARTGIGRTLSELLAQHGYKVIMSAKNASDCQSYLDDLTKKGFSVAGLGLDLSQPKLLKEKVKEASSIWGTIDVLINNAAIVNPIAKLGNLTPDGLIKASQVNFISPVLLINHCWEHLKKSNGKIINILSGAAIHPVEGWATYCATKAALHMINQQTHLEGINYNIKSIGISPGMVDTAMQEKIRESGINRISKVKKSDLLPVELPAQLGLWCTSDDTNDLSGKMISLSDPVIEKRFAKWKLQNLSSK